MTTIPSFQIMRRMPQAPTMAGTESTPATLPKLSDDLPGMYANLNMPGAPTDYRQAGEAEAMKVAVGGGTGTPSSENMTPAGGGWGYPKLAAPPVAAGAPSASRAGGASAPMGSPYGAVSPALADVMSASEGLVAAKTQAHGNDVLALLANNGALVNPGDSPEVRSNKFAYLGNRLSQDAAHILGLSPDGPNAPGTPVYTGNRAPGTGVATRTDGNQPKPNVMDLLQGMNTSTLPKPTNDQLAETMATAAANARYQAGQPHYIEDPVTGERKMIFGKDVVNSGTNPQKTQFPKPMKVGERTLLEVSPGKFADEKGNPVDWRTDERPLSVNEFLISPALSGQYDNDYSKYRAAYSKQAASVTTSKPAPTPSNSAPSAGSPTLVTSKDQFDALPQGAAFLWNGRSGTKK